MNQQSFVVTLGEIMLRLKSPGHERLLQSPLLEATFGGGEANVAVSLANFGVPARFVTALPDNLLGDATVAFLRSMNVDTSCIIRQGKRLGIYFLEVGSGPRSSLVIYDRTHSSIFEASTSDFDWDTIFKDASWFHITGITPALSKNCAELAIHAVQFAKKNKIKVSCDLNYRKKLWKYGKTAPEVMREITSNVDIIIANEEDIQKSLGMTLDQQIGGVSLSREKYERLGNSVLNEFPNVETIAITLRESFSADHNDWSAMCITRKDRKALYSRKYQLKDIVDRVGGGDSFAAGFIYGLKEGMKIQDALEFGVAASALKHTIVGDCNRVRISEVKRLVEGNAFGRVQR
ncbi:MAG: PfkB family carbohydrate kinase [Promethearchaeota archaeon]